MQKSLYVLLIFQHLRRVSCFIFSSLCCERSIKFVCIHVQPRLCLVRILFFFILIIFSAIFLHFFYFADNFVWKRQSHILFNEHWKEEWIIDDVVGRIKGRKTWGINFIIPKAKKERQEEICWLCAVFFGFSCPVGKFMTNFHLFISFFLFLWKFNAESRFVFPVHFIINTIFIMEFHKS